MTADRGPMETALDDALQAAPAAGRDVAGVALARHLAGLMDRHPDADAAVRLAPRYLATLSALGLTVAGRRTGSAPVEGGGRDDGSAGGKLDELRERRAKRERAREH